MRMSHAAWKLLACISLCQSAVAATPSQDVAAISAVVTGNDQHVGFRALVMKQAIQYNLAGFVKNEPNDGVAFTLQGRPKRIAKAVEAIRAGTRTSSDIDVKAAPAPVDPRLATFTIVGWTSTSRQITTPYTLVFALRSPDETVSRPEAKDVWHDILRRSLKGDDLKKLGDD